VNPALVQRSFRDPGGVVEVTADRVLRAVNEDGWEDFEALSCSEAGQRLFAQGDLISTTALDLDVPTHAALAREVFGRTPTLLLQHERVAFPTYPYEWPPEMLHAAGVLTLRIARELLEEGLGLKDATPFNILFRGPNPVMVDILSIERRGPGDTLWRAEAQFARSFIIPLLLHAAVGLAPHTAFLASRDGISPEQAYRMTGIARRFSPSFLRWITLPAWLSGTWSAARVSRQPASTGEATDSEKARFILDHLLRRLERAMVRLAPEPGRRSTWSEYESCGHYDEAAVAAKAALVETVISRTRPRSVLDVGCNVGRFSRLAASRGASVVAIDLDPVVVGRLWRHAVDDQLDILPLVQNLALPSPATGWWNRECPAFVDRAAGRFDLLLMLAVVHHLLVTDRIPLDQIVAMAAHLTIRDVVVEYVGPDDSMFRRIARGREHLHAGLTPTAFEAAWSRHFRLIDRQGVGDTGRVLYWFERAR
jgi:SAM-dependent methyltransferase